jgi:hypothetical protein
MKTNIKSEMVMKILLSGLIVLTFALASEALSYVNAREDAAANSREMQLSDTMAEVTQFDSVIRDLDSGRVNDARKVLGLKMREDRLAVVSMMSSLSPNE